MHLVGAAGKIQQQSLSICGKVVRMHVLSGSWVVLVPFNSLFLSFCCVLWDGELPPHPTPNAVTVLIVSLLPSCLKAVGWFRRLREPSQIPRWLGDHGRTEDNIRRVGGNQYLSHCVMAEA